MSICDSWARLSKTVFITVLLEKPPLFCSHTFHQMLNLLLFRQRSKLMLVIRSDHSPCSSSSQSCWMGLQANQPLPHQTGKTFFLYGLCSQRHCRPANLTSKYAGMFCHCKVHKKKLTINALATLHNVLYCSQETSSLTHTRHDTGETQSKQLSCSSADVWWKSSYKKKM